MNAQATTQTEALTSVGKTAYRNDAAPQVGETFDCMREFFALNPDKQRPSLAQVKP
jgi:hypothetical protein